MSHNHAVHVLLYKDTTYFTIHTMSLNVTFGRAQFNPNTFNKLLYCTTLSPRLYVKKSPSLTSQGIQSSSSYPSW